MSAPIDPPSAGAGDSLFPRGRRGASLRVREARDRLTSAAGTLSFDYELLRQYVETRIAASAVVLILILGVGLVAGLIGDRLLALLWVSGMIVLHALIIMACRRFLADTGADARLRSWRLRFIALDAVFGMAWMLIILNHPSVQNIISISFMLFVLMLVIGLFSTLSVTMPAAVFVATLPVTVATAFDFLWRATLDGYILATLSVGAAIYFALLALRTHSNMITTLQARAEKDALIVELEHAKVISDEARYRAEAANVSKSRFLAQMSHELRTPLNAILGFSEVMKGEIFGPHSASVYRDYSADIHNSGVHLLNLINEILDLSRIEAGRYELNETAVSLVGVATDCHHLLKLRSSSRGLTIHQVYESDLPKIWADERATRQITLNLLSNAIKFTPQGGEIWIKVGWTASGGQYLSVKDTGPGIPEDEIPIVLESFGQGTNSIKSAEQGAGLGLPIARNLITMHGGTLSLKSKLRIGTEVIVTFPPERVMSTLMPVTPAPPLQPAETARRAAGDAASPEQAPAPSVSSAAS